MFKKNKNKEKKGKWWAGQGTNTFEADAGSNYKVVSGLMILLCSGLVLIAIAVVIQGTPTLVAQHNSLKPLWIAGGVICGAAFVGIMISVFLQMAVGKKREAADTEMQKLKSQITQQTQKYHESRKTMLTPSKPKKVD